MTIAQRQLQASPKTPWQIGAALARAGRALPAPAVLQWEWQFNTAEVALVALGYLEVWLGIYFSIHTRLLIESRLTLLAERIRAKGK